MIPAVGDHRKNRQQAVVVPRTVWILTAGLVCRYLAQSNTFLHSDTSVESIAWTMDHRLGTIRNMDRIYVLDHGQVVESGSHQQLAANPEGLYSRLVALQVK